MPSSTTPPACCCCARAARSASSAPPLVRRWLNRYLPVEPSWPASPIRPGPNCPWTIRWTCRLPDGTPSGLRVRAFEVDRHVPRFVAGRRRPRRPGRSSACRSRTSSTGGRLVYAPCVASLGEPLVTRPHEADCLLIDGTFWDDDEPIRCGIGSRTAREMGHLPVSGPEGSLAGWPACRPATACTSTSTTPIPC